MPTRRREFLHQAAAAACGLAAGPLRPLARTDAAEAPTTPPLGKAEHCIFLWLGGGACHIDTWDPKQLGDPKLKRPGSYYRAIDTAISGTKVCEHLSKTAPLLDRCAIVRSLHHEVIDEHAAAVNRLHTGRPTADSIIYPSLGSVVSQQLGPVDESVPAYVLIGYPNVTRGPGFLGVKYGYVYLTDTRTGPSGLTQSRDVGPERQARREQLLEAVRSQYVRNAGGGQPLVRDYDVAISAALRLAGPEFMSVFQLDREPAALRESYGGEFGQRCLLARRLVQAGTRFVEVSHNLNFVNGTGWDTHNEGQLKQHELVRELDTAFSSLISDLESQRLLDKTLVVVATEFGRPAHFDGGGGRGHHSKAFSVVLAGGGLHGGRAIGQTDELGMKIVDRPVSVPDLHATIYAALGIDPAEELFAGDRPVPITDHGHALTELWS